MNATPLTPALTGSLRDQGATRAEFPSAVTGG